MAKLMEFRIINGEAVSGLWTFMGNLDMAIPLGEAQQDDYQWTSGGQGVLALGIPINAKFGGTVFWEVFPGLSYLGAGLFWYEAWIAAAAGLAFENGTMYNGYEGSSTVPYLTARIDTRGIIDEILTALHYNIDTSLLDFIFGFTMFKDALASLPGGVRLSVEHNPVLDTTTWAVKSDFRISDTTRLRTAAYVVSNETAFAGFIDPRCWGFSIFFEPLAELSYKWKWLFGVMLDPMVGIVGVIGFSISFNEPRSPGIRASTREGIGFKDGYPTMVFRARDFSYFGNVTNPPVIPDIGP
jgi:hypothetical protein